jgi:opacity protein-like surface antigen
MSRSHSFFRQPSLWITVALVLLLGAGTAQAQGYSGSREGHWEFTLAPLYQMSNSIDFEGGSKLKTDSELGFGLGFGYNLSDQFNLGFGFDWYSVSYDATVIKDTGGPVGITGNYDSWLTWANLTMNLAEGPFVPYISAGIGYSFIDTNVPDGRPVEGCYWDPWWGYICGTYYPTKTSSDFSYNAGVGLRYQFSPTFFTKLGYQMTWLDLGKAKGTPSFDQIRLDFGWMY